MTAVRRPAPPPDGPSGWRVSGGIDVDVDDLYALSARCRDAASVLDAVSAEVGRACVCGEAAVAVLGAADPARRAAVRRAADAVAAAPRRLPAATVGIAALGLRVALAAERYAGSEAAAERGVRYAGATIGYLDGLAGRKAGHGRGVGSGGDGSRGVGSGGGPAVDPDSLSEVVAGPLAATYRERAAVVGPATSLGGVPPPTGIADLLGLINGAGGAVDDAGGGGTDDDASGPPPAGRVDVVAITTTGRQGAAHTTYVVALPGTSDWSLPGAPPRDDVRNLHANLQLMSGNATAELRALPAALAGAGVPAGASVAFVGHSQGGMTAYAAASDPVLRARYRVAAVVTAGSPIGAMAAPGGVPVLALENLDDVVPRLDGRRNPDARDRVTVAFAGAREGAAHDLDQYVAAGRRIDRAVAHGVADPAEAPLTSVVEALRDAGVLPAVGASAQATRTRVELRLGPS